MSATDPPWLATALLRRFVPAEEALIGDLQEEYGSGRSSRWYWWQVGAALASAVRHDLRHHTVDAGGAIVVALTVYVALSISGAAIANDISRALTPHVPRWTLDYQMYQTAMSILWVSVAAWTIGVVTMTLTRSHGTVAILALLLYVALVEYPRWTLVPWLWRPEGLPAAIVLTQTAVTLVKLAALLAGALAFAAPAGDYGQRASPR